MATAAVEVLDEQEEMKMEEDIPSTSAPSLEREEESSLADDDGLEEDEKKLRRKKRKGKPKKTGEELCSDDEPEEPRVKRARRVSFERSQATLILRALRKAGSEGLSIGEIVEELYGRGGKAWLHQKSKTLERTMGNLARARPGLWLRKAQSVGRHTYLRFVWAQAASHRTKDEEALETEFEELAGFPVKVGAKLEIDGGNVVISERNLLRMLVILRLVQKENVVAQPTTEFQKAIEASEKANQTFDGLVCRKTVRKFIGLLHNRGSVVFMETMLGANAEGEAGDEIKVELVGWRGLGPESNEVRAALLALRQRREEAALAREAKAREKQERLNASARKKAQKAAAALVKRMPNFAHGAHPRKAGTKGTNHSSTPSPLQRQRGGESLDSTLDDQISSSENHVKEEMFEGTEEFDLSLPPKSLRVKRRKSRKVVAGSEPKKAAKKPRRTAKPKQRFDEEDLASQSRSLQARSTYSSREREILLFIKAVSVFLIEGHRLCMSQATLRDVMHSRVPESRTKTAQGLTACLNRDLLRRPEKVAVLRSSVRRLEALEPLLDWRRRQPKLSWAMGEAERDAQFLEAFQLAESFILAPPPTQGPAIHMTPEQMRSAAALAETKKGEATHPLTLAEIQTATVRNAILGAFVQGSGKSAEERRAQQSLFKQFPEAAFARSLAALRSAGLVSFIIRTGETRRTFQLSAYFRNLLHHRFSANLVSDAGSLCESLEGGGWVGMESNAAGYVPVAAALIAESGLEMRSVLEAEGSEAEERELLALRDKQRAVVARSDRRSLSLPNATSLPKVNLAELSMRLREEGSLTALKGSEEEVAKAWSALSDLGPVPAALPDFEAAHLKGRSREERRVCLEILALVRGRGMDGIELEELQSRLGWQPRFKDCLSLLIDHRQLLRVGVERECWAVATCARHWYVQLASQEEEEGETRRIYRPRPWLNPDASFNLPMLKWMCEGVLLLLAEKGGLDEEKLLAQLRDAFQPVLIREILNFLHRLSVIRPYYSRHRRKEFVSAFGGGREEEVSELIWFPTSDAILRFAPHFANVPLPEFLNTAKEDRYS